MEEEEAEEEGRVVSFAPAPDPDPRRCPEVPGGARRSPEARKLLNTSKNLPETSETFENLPPRSWRARGTTWHHARAGPQGYGVALREQMAADERRRTERRAAEEPRWGGRTVEAVLPPPSPPFPPPLHN